MILTSPNFNHGEPIPRKFTCEGFDVNSELAISNVPAEAKSLVLIVDDPDAPNGTWTHWTVWNIDPETTMIKDESVPPRATEGMTSKGNTGFHGPCPPPGKPHRYFFKLFALDAVLELKEGASRGELEAEIAAHKIAEAELMGTYERH
jgi:Raf kinase inhibitor-like YbhB/YbcL family protein